MKSTIGLRPFLGNFPEDFLSEFPWLMFSPCVSSMVSDSFWLWSASSSQDTLRKGTKGILAVFIISSLVRSGCSSNTGWNKIYLSEKNSVWSKRDNRIHWAATVSKKTAAQRYRRMLHKANNHCFFWNLKIVIWSRTWGSFFWARIGICRKLRKRMANEMSIRGPRFGTNSNSRPCELAFIHCVLKFTNLGST